MPTKPTASSTPSQGRLPVVVMPDALSYFAHDSAWGAVVGAIDCEDTSGIRPALRGVSLASVT
jgi:hypothetical protein